MSPIIAVDDTKMLWPLIHKFLKLSLVCGNLTKRSSFGLVMCTCLMSVKYLKYTSNTAQTQKNAITLNSMLIYKVGILK